MKRGAALGVAASAYAGAADAFAQAALDPNVAPRAVALERGGERGIATDMLGRYLAMAPDDGRAWLHLGRFYLLDAREWHTHEHRGDPSALLYLDFAGTALDQALRLRVDSAVVFRALVALERVRSSVEESGWLATRQTRAWRLAPELPPFIVELGLNLLGSCPADGVMLTGNDLETLSVWYTSIERGHRPDIVPLRPDLYAVDSLYRSRMAQALGVDPTLPVQRALVVVAERRPLCLTPLADSSAAPLQRWSAVRLVRVSRAAPPTSDVLTVSELVRAQLEARSVWVRDTREVYYQAARHNRLLCGGLLVGLADTPPPTCEP